MTTRRIGAWDVVRRLGADDAVVARGSESFLVRPGGGADELFELHRVIEPGRPENVVRAKLERFAQLRHSALAPVVDCFSHEGAVAVVIAHTKGMVLDQLQDNLRRDHDELEDSAVWFVGAELAGALAIGHAARDGRGDLAPFVHGRLSLRHVMVTRAGEVRLLAFCPGLVVTGMDPAGAAWQAPETRRGEHQNPSVDAYAVALVMHCLLTGRQPALARSPIPLAEARPDVPSDIAELIDGVLDRNLRDSRPSCAELAHRFGALVQSKEGQVALQESMELYRALTGLFSVSAPPVEVVVEEPLLLSQKLPEIDPVADLVADLPDDEGDASPRPIPPAAEEQPAEDREERAPFSSPDLASTLVSRVEPPDAKDAERGDPERGASDDGDDRGGADDVKPRASDDGEEPEPQERRVDAAEEREVSPVDASAADAHAATADAPSTMRGVVFAAVGVVIGLAAWWGLRDGDPGPTPEPPPRATSEAVPRGSAPVASTPKPPTPSPSSAPAPSTQASSAPASPAPSSSADGGQVGMAEGPPTYTPLDDPLSVGFNQGRLVVRSPVEAGVFVQGLHVGTTNADNVVSCGMRNVRLGTLPAGERWYTQGKPVSVRCRERTTITILPDPESP